MSRFASAAAFRSAYATDASLGTEPAYVQAPLKRTKELGLAPLQCFRKPVTCSGRVPLKGTAGKKLRTAFAGLFKSVPEAEWDTLWPKKANVTSEKLAGAGLADLEHKPIVYWIERSGNDNAGLGEPLFVDLSGGHADAHMVWPTVYALALAPSLLRPMVVHPGVSKFIVQGADCMWPGVISEADADANVGRFQRGERRALFALGNPVPFAVGYMTSDSASVIAANRTGKALSIVHCYRDALWDLGSKTSPNVGFVKDRVYAVRLVNGTEQEEEDDDGDEVEDASGEVAAATASVATAQLTDDAAAAGPPADASIADTASTAPTTNNTADSTTATTADGDEEDDDDATDAGADAEADADSDVSAAKANTAEMDAALLRCFLYAVQTRVLDSELPMSPSTLLSHMEACNLGPPERLDVRRSSYKKMAKFLKELSKLGLAKSKTGGGKQGMCSIELQVMSVSRTSPMLAEAPITKAFLDAIKRKQKSGEKQHAAGAAAAAASASSADAPRSAVASASSGSGGKFQIMYRYRPDQKLQRFLFVDETDAKRLFTGKEAKQRLTDYTAAHELDLAGGKTRLDTALYETLYHGTDKPPSGVQPNVYQQFLRAWAANPSSATMFDVTKADLAHRFESHLVEYYAVTHDANVDESELTFKKGPLPTIDVALEKRQQKVMTKVSGFEVYGLDPLQFARDAQKAFACATSTAVIPANNKHKAFVAVYIQGNVTSDVGAKLHVMYGFPQHCVKLAKK